MADRQGIELARCGKWDLSTGPLEVTPDMLHDAVRRAADAGPSFRAAVKLGHTDPRNDGEPAFGWIHNLRVQGSADDAVLLGDVKDMPNWLADVAPSAYPDRSIEGLEYKDDEGQTVGFEITGLALLGVTPPGMSTIETWRDLPQALGVAAGALSIAASFKATNDVQAAAVSDTAWSKFSDSDYNDQQYAKACVLDRGLGAGTAKQRHALPVREPDGTLNRNAVHAAAAALGGGRGGVSASDAAKKAAAVRLVGHYKNDLKEQPPQALLDLAGVKASSDHTPPAEPPADPTTQSKEADTMSDTLTKGLRERLGIGDDVVLDESQLLAKLDERTSAPPTPEAIAAAHKLTTEQVTKALQDAAKPVDDKDPKLPDGMVAVNASVLDELKIAAKAGAEARVVQLKQDRDTTIDAAFRAGKIAAGRKDHWAKQWDADPEGTKKALEELPEVYAIAASGYSGAPDMDKDSEDQLFRTFFPENAEAKA